MKSVTIYSDGGCHGNPGPGGWGAVLIYGSVRKELTGAEAATTNNRMELTACIQSLKALKEPCRVEIHTDSQYVKRGMTEWLPKWKAKGWRRGKDPIKNLDLWKSLDLEAARHELQWKWVRGHAGNPLNERCDELANAAIAKLRTEFSSAALAEALARFQASVEGGLI